MNIKDLVQLFESHTKCAEALYTSSTRKKGISPQHMWNMLNRGHDVALLADGRYVVLNKKNMFCEVNIDEI